MSKSLLAITTACLLLVIVLSACGAGDKISLNPLGFNFVWVTIHNNKQNGKVVIPSSHAQSVAGLRPYGLGVPPEGFLAQYGQPLPESNPPTQVWFQATLDDFMSGGSVMIAGFDRSSTDSAPRANEISYVAGDNHPTTITQAETITESFLPSDAQGPKLLNQYNGDKQVCQTEIYTSATLAKLFPAQDFIDANGKVTTAGTVTLSLFPHYPRETDTASLTVSPTSGDVIEDQSSGPDDANQVSSFLLTLGTKPYC